MTDEDVLAYLRGGGSHFFSFADIPVVDEDSSIGVALTAACDYGTRGVVVRGADNQFGFATVDDLVGFQHSRGVVAESVHAPVREIGPVRIAGAEMSAPIARVREKFEAPGVKVMFESGRAIGLLSEAEDWESRFFQVPTIYYCPNGHAWGPPPPTKCFCDGEPVA
ncbi:MAG: hypothetical protein ACQGVK_06455 [Myxococcota bacterium]